MNKLAHFEAHELGIEVISLYKFIQTHRLIKLQLVTLIALLDTNNTTKDFNLNVGNFFF